RVRPVQPGVGNARLHQLSDPPLGPPSQLVQLPELDRIRRARLRAGRLHTGTEPVVAHRAFPRPAVSATLVDHPVRACGDAVPAPVADVLLHDHGAELRTEQRPSRADVQAGGVRAVLAHVGRHQPAEVTAGLGRTALLDERHVPPGVSPEPDRVVVGHAGQRQPVLRHVVPLLARHLARLTPDADRSIGEELHPRRRVRIAVEHVEEVHCSVPVCEVIPARRWYSRTSAKRPGPPGRRPGLMSQAKALTSWMCEFGSRLTEARSLAASPVLRPFGPQWYGMPTWCRTRPCTVSGAIRSVTSTRASTAFRAVTIVAQPRCSSPRSTASSGDTSQKNSG